MTTANPLAHGGSSAPRGCSLVLLALISGCAGGSHTTRNPEPAGNSASAGGSVAGTVTVLAAASLTEAFTVLGSQFEKGHPGVRVRFSFGSSSTLARQIIEGAPADVFASASVRNMTQVRTAGAAAAPATFAGNVMQIAVPPTNPAHLTQLSDLSRAGVTVALCQPQVPCGVTATEVFARAGITLTPVTLEADVKSTLVKVELNEVDAAVVYATDVRAAGSRVRGIPIPAGVNASTDYPIATLTEAPNPVGARAFTAYVLSGQGQRVLAAAGFARP